MLLKDKVCIITGSSSGIGKATAIKFAKEGAIVAIAALPIEDVNLVVEEIKKMGGRAHGFLLDVRNKGNIKAIKNELMEKYGKIDVLINNAGIIKDAQLKNMTEEQFDLVIDINLKGTYNCTREIIDVMIAQKHGVILNTSSIVGIYGNFGQTNYAASKFGVIGFTKTWAKELGKYNIRTNAVCPGFIATHIIDDMPEKVIKDMEEKVPMKRLGKPEEIAEVYAFLASDGASYVNGAVIEVSGGLSI